LDLANALNDEKSVYSARLCINEFVQAMKCYSFIFQAGYLFSQTFCKWLGRHRVIVFAVRGNYFDPIERWPYSCRAISFIPDFFSFPAAANFSGRSAFLSGAVSHFY
jgi:hypothetical protein